MYSSFPQEEDGFGQAPKPEGSTVAKASRRVNEAACISKKIF